MKFIRLGATAIFTFSLITFSLLLLFEFTLTERARFYYVVSQCKTCHAASALAKRDFDKGSYLLIRWGLPEAVTVVIGEVLETDYKVDQMYGGCVVRHEVDCYTQAMYSLLQQKFGPEFYLEARNRAHRIYVERMKRH